MSSGFCSGFADVIEEEAVAKLCLQELAEFHKVLSESGINFDSFAQCYKFEEPDVERLQEFLADAAPEELGIVVPPEWLKQKSDAIDAAFQALKKSFAAATHVEGSELELCVGHHDSEEVGSGYDEVDGAYWAVDGAYQLSPAGEKFEDVIERKFFVVGG